MTLAEKLKTLPDNPGVYIMKNIDGRIIYVGKAINLKNRVRSYFRHQPKEAAKTRALVRHIADLEYIITDGELEALVLECNLIKKHRPKYNISLKDDKTYPYIRITKEDFPQVIVTRHVVKDGSRYFGPYPSVGSLRDTLEVLRRIFPYRSCRRNVFNNARPCLNAHINRCCAPCNGQVSKADYHEMIQHIVRFFEGHYDELASRLQAEMHAASEALNFEKAALLRDQLRDIEQVLTEQKATLSGDGDQDVIALAHNHRDAAVQVFFIRSGKIIGREHYHIEQIEDEDESAILGSFVKQFYHNQESVPRQITLAVPIPDHEIIAQWLSKAHGHNVTLHVPMRGKQKDLIRLVEKNASEALEKFTQEMARHKERTWGALEDLASHLGLVTPPRRIECYDISNTQGQQSVASMVVFVDGKAKKDQYRRFKIKTVEGPNDFASMYEVISRRFAHAAKEQAEYADENKFAELPDLVILDGGKGQLHYARRAMREQHVAHIPTYGLAKEDELLFHEGSDLPIVVPRSSNALFLLQRIRDEAHRFAITYHRSLRGKRQLASVLDDIPGIGKKRREALLRHFGTFARINSATPEELAQVQGISPNLAETIAQYLATHQDLQQRLKIARKAKPKGEPS